MRKLSTRGAKVTLLPKALIAFGAVLCLAPASASADALFYNWDMYTQSVNTYAGERIVNRSDQSYRWVDRPPTSSRISTNNCRNYSEYLYEDFGQTTSYERIDTSPSFPSGSPQFSWSPGRCITYRGRSLGSFAFFDHDGSALY